MRKVITAVLVGALAFSGVTGCAKRTIDKEETHSVEVPGTDGSLLEFCDGSILIYWTPSIRSGEDDDYEFIVYDGCKDGQIVNGAGARDINPGTPPTEDLDSGEED